jgi:hypothetical protein
MMRMDAFIDDRHLQRWYLVELSPNLSLLSPITVLTVNESTLSDQWAHLEKTTYSWEGLLSVGSWATSQKHPESTSPEQQAFDHHRPQSLFVMISLESISADRASDPKVRPATFNLNASTVFVRLSESEKENVITMKPLSTEPQTQFISSDLVRESSQWWSTRMM